MGAVSRFYVTTPIYYVNDVPHIGHAYTTVAGDVLTRWHRLLGDDVFFLTGTDEHGLKIQRAAEAQGLDARRSWSTTARHVPRRRGTLLDIAYDDFIRTTEPRHHTAVQEFLQTIYDAGDIELGTYEGLYCVSCEAYYTEDELVDGNCPIHDRPVEHVTEENYFFKLSRYERPAARVLRRASRSGAARVAPQRGARVHPRRPAGLLDEPHVDHVGRAAAVGPEARRVRVGRRAVQLLHRGRVRRRPASASTKWWPVDYHLVGKDILRFHAVYWPAMLMSAGLEPPKCVFAHGWLLVGGEKMSEDAA